MHIPRLRPAAALTTIALGAATAIIIGPPPGAARPATARPPVIVSCLNKDQIRPSGFVLACADGNSLLKGMHWSAWGSAAHGSGTLWFNDCLPYCARGTFRSFPVLTVLWRPEPLPHHAGVRYYTRITTILPARHCFTAHGKRICYPVASSAPLWAGLPGPVQPVNGSST